MDARPGHPHPVAAGRWRRFAGPLVRLAFRPRLVGVENLPTSGPYLLVSNHSAFGLAEIMAFVVCMVERQAEIGPIAGMVHPISYHSWPHGTWMRRLGAIPSTYEAAEAALASGVAVLVFPGGDHEAGRPIWQANKVDLAGRKGFLKIARKAGVPIVPMGIRGSHYTAPPFWRSQKWLPRLLVIPHRMGIKRMSIPLLGVLGAALIVWAGPINPWVTMLLALLWLVSPLAQLPWIPWTIRMKVGQPIAHADLFPDDSDETLQRAYDAVEEAIQRLVLSQEGATEAFRPRATQQR